MQRTTLNILQLLVIGAFVSSCGKNPSTIPMATITSTSVVKPRNSYIPTFSPTNTPIPPSPTIEYILDKNGTEVIRIPAGEFILGKNSFGIRLPAHNVSLDDYYIDKHEVKNIEFIQFLNENLENISVEIRDGIIIHDTPSQTEGVQIYGKAVYLRGVLIYCIDCFGWDSADPSLDDWDNSIVWDGEAFSILDEREDFPVTMVNWNGAQAYCSWKGAHLPTEAEWFKAYNNGMERNNRVSEWVFDWYEKDYYSHSPYKNPQGPENGEDRLIIGFNPNPDYMDPDFGFWDISFRCSRGSLD